ncbi:MAG: ribosome-associated translation inhibitor RaiA [Patescibacteria group bacterium]|jgi:putative sigma-54 modulation protein
MKYTIKATNFTLTPALRASVEKKIGALDKFLAHTGAVQAYVEIGKTTKHHRTGEVFYAEVQIQAPGKSTLRAEATAQSIALAINTVKDELQRELKRYSGKQVALQKRGARRVKRLAHDIPTGVRDE